MVQIRINANQTSIKLGHSPLVHAAAQAHISHAEPSPQTQSTHVNIRINPRPNQVSPQSPPEPQPAYLPGISILVCTNRPEYIDRVLGNYSRQNYQEKELIVILNNNLMGIEEWRSRSSGYSNVQIFQLDESLSLGECLNAGIPYCRYNFVAKFDDDDYYGPNYLRRQMQAMLSADADIVGKSTWYLYFEGSHTLAVFSRHPENDFVNYVTGATLLVKKHIFNSIRFSAMNVGEDVDFVAVCKEHGFRIYSTDRADFVGIRRALTSSHTWQESDEHILNQCQVIAHTQNYISWANSY
ncbi:MAG: glycosyltransferase family 2 protein [Syntrophomonadaceae bacterium]|nr:glycosyltransferase family 2 protein [Syntrophomonadaceae bacterium]